MDPPWQTGGAQQTHANLKKATHEQAFLVHASSRKLYARARHRRSGPTIARVDRSRCPVGRTRVGSAQSQARITGFLTILTIRKVREILRTLVTGPTLTL